MVLGQELPSQVVQQAAQLDVAASFGSGHPIIRLILLCNVLPVSVRIYAAAFQLGYRACRLIGIPFERTLPYLSNQASGILFRLAVISSQTQQALSLHHQDIGIAEERHIIITGSPVTILYLILYQPVSFHRIASRIVRTADFIRIVQRLAVHINGVSTLVLLDTADPAVCITGVIILVISIQELGQGGSASCSPTGKPESGTPGLVHPQIGKIIATGIQILKRNPEDNLGRRRDVLLKIISIIRRQAEFVRFNDHIQLVNAFPIVRIVGMVVKPSIVIQIHLSKNHVDGIVIYLSHLHLIATLVLYVVQLRDDKIPYFLRFSLFGKPAVGMIISGIQGNITEKVEQKIVIQRTVST